MFQIFVAKQHYFVPSPLVNVFQYRLHICHHHHRLRIRRFQKKITKMTFFDKLIQFTFFMSQFYANFASYNGKVSNNLTLPFSIISHRQQIPTTYLPLYLLMPRKVQLDQTKTTTSRMAKNVCLRFPANNNNNDDDDSRFMYLPFENNLKTN